MEFITNVAVQVAIIAWVIAFIFAMMWAHAFIKWWTAKGDLDVVRTQLQMQLRHGNIHGFDCTFPPPSARPEKDRPLS